MAVPVILKILAEKDSSVDAITKQVQATIAGLSGVQTGDVFGGITNSATEANNSIKGVGDELDKLGKVQFGKASDELHKLTGATREWIQEEVKAEEAGKGVGESFKQAGDYAEKASQKIQSLQAAGTAVGTSLVATGTALLGLSGFAIKTAVEFEQLQAKLVTVTGSSVAAAKAFAFAKDYAAKTPFDVQGIVAATVTLESYKQKAESTLPRVAALAAGLGRPIQETALVMGKALSGSAEGFESLRNEYGITTAELKRYGAEVDKTGQLLIHNEAQISKAGAALKKITDIRFGDAIARQSATAAGALSNAGDAVKNTAESFGSTLLPAVTMGIKVFTAMVEKINGIPTEAKTVIAVLSLLGGGFALAAGTSVLAYTGLVAVQAQLAATTVQSGLTTAALGSTNLALSTMGAVGGTASGIMRGFGASAGGAVLGVVGLGLAIANLVVEYERLKAEKQGQELVDESKRVQAVTQEYRLLLDTLNKVAIARGQKPVVPSSNPIKQAYNIGEKLQNLPKEELVKSFSAARFTTETLKKQFEDLNDKTKTTKDRILAVSTAINLLGSSEKNARPSTAFGKEGLRDSALAEREENVKKAAAALRSAGFQGMADTLDTEKLKAALVGLNNQLNQLGASKQIVGGLKTAFVELADPLAAIVKRATGLKDFFKLSEEINSAQSLAAAYGKVNEQLKVAREAPGIKGKSREQLAIDVADPATPTHVKEAILAIEGLEAQKKASQERILSFEEGQFKKRQFLQSESTQSQLDAVNEQLINVAAGSAKEVSLKKEAARLRKVISQEGLSAEIEFLGQEMKFAEGNAEKQLEIQKQISEAKKQLREKDVNDAKKSLEETNRNARQGLDKVRETPDSTPQEAIKALDGVLTRLRDWEASNKRIIAQNPELKKDYEELVRGAVLEQAREAAKIPVENLTKLKGIIGKIQAGAVGPVRQLEAVERSIALVKQAQISHLITQKAGETELLALAKAKEQAEKAITAEKRAQAAELRNLESQKKDKNVEILEKRKANGENVDVELEKARRDQRKDKYDAIQAEADDYIKAHGNTEDAKTHATKVAEYKREQLRKEQEGKIYDEQIKQEQDFSQSMDRQDQRYQQSMDKRSGNSTATTSQAGIPSGNTPGVGNGNGNNGPNGISPLTFSMPGFGEAYGSIYGRGTIDGLGKNNKEGIDGLGGKRSPYEYARDKAKQQEREATGGAVAAGNDPFRAGSEAATKINENHTYNATLNINGQSSDDKNLLGALKPYADKMRKDANNARLRQGRNRPPVSNPADTDPAWRGNR